MNIKKAIVATVSLGTVLGVQAVGLYIPKSTENNLRLDTLKEGESAYLVSTNGDTATLFIGNGTKTPFKVVDNGAIRGYKNNRELEVNEIGIATDDYMTTDGNGVYSTSHTETYKVRETDENPITGVVGSMIISVPTKYVINNVTYNTEYPLGFGDMHSFKVEETIVSDTRRIISFREIDSGNAASYFRIKNIKVTVMDFGETQCLNDTTTRNFVIKDDEGTYHLNNLRHELYHKYDGNRGEHWANYVAKNHVYLENHDLVFDTNGVFTLNYGVDKTVNLSAYSIDAMQLKENASPDTYTGDLSITAVSKQDDTFQLSYLQSIKKNGSNEFIPAKLQVVYAPSLDKDNRNSNGTGRPERRLLRSKQSTVRLQSAFQEETAVQIQKRPLSASRKAEE